MITYGFFNSVDGDRTYNADDFNSFFEGLISQNGIFENVGAKFKVTADTGMRIAVGAGKALVNNHWCINSETEYITLANADLTLARWDKVVLRYSNAQRKITLEVVTGTPSDTQPSEAMTVTRTPDTYEILLAVVKIPKASSRISAENITDTRAKTKLCGFVTGLIKQVDTTELFDQYEAAYKEQLDKMDAWFKQQQATFNSWYSSLTETLNVDTKIVRTYANTSELIAINGSVTRIIVPIGVLNYTSLDDILDVYVNGVYFVPDIDYLTETTVNEDGVLQSVVLQLITDLRNENTVSFVLTKSVIGH